MKRSGSFDQILKTRLYGFQKRAVRFGLTRKSVALFMDQGTGKTIVSLAILAQRFRNSEAKLVLVVCPKTVIGVWRRAIRRFMRVRSRVYTFQDFSRRPEVREKLKSGNVDTLTFLILSYDTAAIHAKKLREYPWDYAVADESQKIKKHSTRRGRRLHMIGDRVPRKLILSGTPMPQGEIDIWSQYRFMNPRVFPDRFSVFKQKFCRPSGYMGYKLSLKRGMKDEFNKLLHRHAFRITQDEALDLPPATDQYLYVELDGKAAKAYHELETQLFTYIEEENIQTTTPLAITKMLRLQQITGGYLHGDDGNHHRIGSQKLSAFRDFAEDWVDKLVVFCRFRPEIEDVAAVCKKLGHSVVTYHGGTPTKLRDSLWQRFQDELHPRVFVAQIGTGGIGIDLFASCTGVFYSTTFSWEDYDQARKRILRNGQTRPVKFIHIQAEGTIDKYISKALKRKGNVAKQVLDLYRGFQP